jgi:branched-chain amino acid transport system permease protein
MSVAGKILKSPKTFWVLAAAAACLPIIANLVEFPYLVRVGGVVGLFMLLALGLNFTLGYVGLFDLGFIAFYAIGAYTTAIAMKAHVPAPLAVLLAIVVTAAARLLLGLTILRLRGDYLAVVTMGFGEIARLTITISTLSPTAPRACRSVPGVLWLSSRRIPTSNSIS